MKSQGEYLPEFSGLAKTALRFKSLRSRVVGSAISDYRRKQLRLNKSSSYTRQDKCRALNSGRFGISAQIGDNSE